jgi:hypothetical protein
MKLFSFPVFLISFAIGFLVVYLTAPPPKPIMVYPTPENVSELLYRDKAGQCYNFKAKELTCPDDVNHIKKVPPQTEAHPDIEPEHEQEHSGGMTL